MNRNTASLVAAVWLLLLAALATTHADAQTVPALINYQGKLVNSNGLPVSTGDYELRFRIYDAATNGNLIWGPQVFNGQTGPGYGRLVPVVQGWFNVILGPTDTNGTAVTAAFSAPDRFLEVQIGTNVPILPPQQILSAPFALRAGQSETAATAQTANFATTALNVLGGMTTQDVTLYVSTNGANQSDGLTPATAKRTIQAAIDTIPTDVRHYVRILIAPGTYFESVNLRDKRGTVTTFPIVIEGVRTNPALVRIDGQSGLALLVQGSGLEIAGITFTNQSGWTVYGQHRSSLQLTLCNLDVQNGLLLVGYSRGLCDDCIFRSPEPIPNSTAIFVDEMSFFISETEAGIRFRIQSLDMTTPFASITAHLCDV